MGSWQVGPAQFGKDGCSIMEMSTEDWIVLSNMLVVLSSLLVAWDTEHDAIKAMRDTILAVIHSSRNNPNITNSQEKEE